MEQLNQWRLEYPLIFNILKFLLLALVVFFVIRFLRKKGKIYLELTNVIAFNLVF